MAQAAPLHAAEQMGLEGIVSKRADGRYRSGPSKSWLKTKWFVESDFDVLGVVREPGQAPQALMATGLSQTFSERAIIH